MVLLIDANVMIDVLTKREPFYESAKRVFDLCIKDGNRGVLWTGEITTIHYIMLKALGKRVALQQVEVLLALFDAIAVTKEDMVAAATSGMSDFEDAVIAHCAKRAKADYIITRNPTDFAGSPIPTIEPEAFLQQAT